MKQLLLLLVVFVPFGKILSQKPVLDSNTVNNWYSINDINISSNGKYVSYAILPESERSGKKDTLVVAGTNSSWCMKLPDVAQGSFTNDSKGFIYQGKGDSLMMILTGTNKVEKIASSKSFRLINDGEQEWIAYRPSDKKSSKSLVIYNLKKSSQVIYQDVSNFYVGALKSRLILYCTNKKEDTGRLEIIDLRSNFVKNIWQGKRLCSYSFNPNPNKGFAFVGVPTGAAALATVYYFGPGMDTVENLIPNINWKADTTLTLDENFAPVFSSRGDIIYFRLMEKKSSVPNEENESADRINVTIWDYRTLDLPTNENGRRSFVVAVSYIDKHISLLEDHKMRLLSIFPFKNYSEYCIIQDSPGHSDFWWCDSARPSIYLLAIKSGKRTLLAQRPAYVVLGRLSYQLSPGENYVIHYDPILKNYFSYEISSGKIQNLTLELNISWESKVSSEATPQYGFPEGIAGWLQNDQGFLVYDSERDIWLIDPSGHRKPKCITNEFAKKNHIEFTLSGEFGKQVPNSDRILILDSNANLLLFSFDLKNKNSGFFKCRISMNKSYDPALLSMQPLHLTNQLQFLKADHAKAWIVMQESSSKSPNIFYTNDFKRFNPVSSVFPEKQWNWLTTELIDWKLPDGRISQGILYKPENFDSTQKYPLIFNYYDQSSQELNFFNQPQLSNGALKIPWFVSRGYLVFKPDIYFRENSVPGECALDAIVSAAGFLSQFNWVDKNKMGLYGHSFGGGETNYIITHSSIFAAAVEACGPSDAISSYGGLLYAGGNRQWLFEMSQERIRASLWERPDLYIKSSSLFKAHQVSTPLLMMHNKNDRAVPWTQGLEFFNALRRLGKRAWMLSYDGAAHELGEIQAMDYTIRLEQFFDHYLKGFSIPKWMIQNIPDNRNENNLGYEIDAFGKEPEEQKVLFDGKLQVVNDALKSKK